MLFYYFHLLLVRCKRGGVALKERKKKKSRGTASLISIAGNYFAKAIKGGLVAREPRNNKKKCCFYFIFLNFPVDCK